MPSLVTGDQDSNALRMQMEHIMKTFGWPVWGMSRGFPFCFLFGGFCWRVFLGTFFFLSNKNEENIWETLTARVFEDRYRILQ